MKILNKIVIALAVLLAPAAASAQYFDHLTAGVAVGTDGVSLQVAAPVGEIVELRLNGSWWPSFIHTSVTRNLNMTNYDGTPRGASDVTVLFEPALKGGGLMVDLFTGSESPFHFTAGLSYGPASLLKVYNKEPFLEKSDWGTAGLKIGDTFITTDKNGICHLGIEVNQLRPYLGIGLGRSIPKLNPVSVSVDFGAYYAGPWGCWADGRNLNNVAKVNHIQITSADVNNEDGGVLDVFAKIPVFPVLRFNVNVKLF